MKKILPTTLAFIFAAFVAEAANAPLASSTSGMTAIQDAPSVMRAELFAQLPRAEFRKLAGAEGAEASVNVFLMKQGDKLILFDAGNGGERGQLMRELERLGIAPGEVDCILLTHMHGDHIGGMLGVEGKAAFPNAAVYVSAPELAYWQQEATGQGGVQARRVMQAYDGRVHTFRFGDEVLPGIRAHDAAGHTPGHAAFETDTWLIIGDALHAAAIQLPRPEICAAYDKEPGAAVQTRKRLYEHALATGKLVAGMHLPYPGTGQVVRKAAGYGYELVAGE